MTPLIDVVFLIIIFFIMIMNITDVISSKVTLPVADESKETRGIEDLTIIVQSESLFYVGLRQVPLSNIMDTLKRKYPHPQGQTVQLRADENVPYETVRKIMQEIAAAGITRINFSTRTESFSEDPRIEGSRLKFKLKNRKL
jgi:biopolymer transport protein ExbD